MRRIHTQYKCTCKKYETAVLNWTLLYIVTVSVLAKKNHFCGFYLEKKNEKVEILYIT